MLTTPFEIPVRVPVWENGERTREHILRATGVVVTELTETRVSGYVHYAGNAVFNVKRNKYGFSVGGCRDTYYFSDVGKQVTNVL